MWLSDSHLGLPSESPGFKSDRRTEISSYGLRDLNQFYHIGTHNTAAGEMIKPAKELGEPCSMVLGITPAILGDLGDT